MKLLINASNLVVGGGVQVAVSFINELLSLKLDNSYYILMSPKVYSQIDVENFTKNFYFYRIEISASSLLNRKKVVKQLNVLEKEINPELTFSIFAPSYWRPSGKHLVGFALGWITNPRSLAFKALNFKQKIMRSLDSIYKSYYIKRDSDFFIVETDDVKNKLCNVLNIVPKDVFVIGNTYSSDFNLSQNPQYTLPPKKENEFRLITIAHNYPHKNIKIIKNVLAYLKNCEMNYTFFITIDDIDYKKNFSGLEGQVINLGPIESKHCPFIYKQCDALFLPTLLESFTASYPEAMKMEKPILTSDLSFAHSICKDSAIYFDPLRPENIAYNIIRLANNKKLQTELINNGNHRLNDFETANSRAKKYIEVCNNIIKQ
jgi:glycosyltransferase involved in cell wall biosynthesis